MLCRAMARSGSPVVCFGGNFRRERRTPMNQTTRIAESTTSTEAVLHMALELGAREWKLGFGVEAGRRASQRTIGAGDLNGLMQEIARARHRLGVPESARGGGCYEAGRDGFWLHRFLLSQGVENVVMDSSSIEVNRRHRRAKTDGVDVEKLLSLLIRFERGEKKVFGVAHAPTPEQEDERHLARELESLKRERTAHTNRIKGLLASVGARVKVGKSFLQELAQVKQWNGERLLASLRERLRREGERLALLESQIAEVERSRRKAQVEAT